jgi:hypothetical protein
LVVLCVPFTAGSHPRTDEIPNGMRSHGKREGGTALYYNHPDYTRLVTRERVEERLHEAETDRLARETRAAAGLHRSTLQIVTSPRRALLRALRAH